MADHAAGFEPADPDRWRADLEKELRGKPVEDLTWHTPAGIDVKPLYTEADLEGLTHLGGMPGQAPYVRGPYASMYTNRPWTLRQYAGLTNDRTASIRIPSRISMASSTTSSSTRSPSRTRTPSGAASPASSSRGNATSRRCMQAASQTATMRGSSRAG